MPRAFTALAILIAACIAVAGIALARKGRRRTARRNSRATPIIDKVKQLKVVWDFNFQDPKTVGVVLNNLNALLKATSDFGPKEIDPLKVVIVSHGPEVVVWAKKNYGKYKTIVDRAASFAKQGVRFEICRNDARALGFKPEDCTVS